LAALNGFRPKFRQIAQTLTDVDLVFVEEAMERWMLEYDRAFACRSLFSSLFLLSQFPSLEFPGFPGFQKRNERADIQQYTHPRASGVEPVKSKKQIRNSPISFKSPHQCSETVNYVYTN